MSREISIDDTLEVNPSSFDDDASQYASISSSYPASNGLTPSSSTTYAQFNLTTGSQAYTRIYYDFDCSSIPEGATINSVTCSTKTYINTTNSSRISQRVIQLYSGSTAKGSTSTISNSTSAYDMTPGTWTRAELQDAKIVITVRRGTSSTTSSYYVRFYGATFTINYSVDGIMYDIMATSNVEGITVEPETQEIFQGGTATVAINTSSLDNIEVTDNDTDVTSLLVRKERPTGGTIERYPASYTTSGSISGSNYTYCIGRGSDTASSSGNDYASGGSGSTAHIDYSFDFSDIPANATIQSVSLSVKGHCENASQSSEIARCQAYSGNTTKGSSVDFTSTTDTVHTMSVGTWTREELQDAILRFTIGYYGGKLVGATWEVTYTVPSGDPYYYEYTITSIADDHIVVVNSVGPYIPPEEEEGYTYYPITISSINAVTTPHSGTTRMKEGESVVVEIAPTEAKITLALDNGVDITNQLVGGADPTYSVATAPGASYGFSLNGSNYYESTNQGHSNSAAVARVTLNLPTAAIVTFDFINYAEATYDYGIFGNVDDSLSTNYTPDSNYKLACSTAAQNTSSVQTVSYEVEAGEHFIDVKYFKDQYTDNNNDSLQFKVSIEATGTGTYTYTLNNIAAKHSLIFVFGDVQYYFINTSSTGAKLFPDGQSVILHGYSYRLIVVPDSTTAAITATDNNVDVTSSLVRQEAIDSKTGATIVNYIYELTDVVAAHNIVISFGDSGQKIYIKLNDTWREYSKVYVKVNGAWVEQSNWSTVFNTNTKYVHKSNQRRLI